jgi:hypothetical protein
VRVEGGAGQVVAAAEVHEGLGLVGAEVEDCAGGGEVL